MQFFAKRISILIVILFIIYSRFVGLNWGLPYPMHPDERNMASAIQSLKCQVTNDKLQEFKLNECLYPNFFAYGQLPLYLGYGIAKTSQLFTFHNLDNPISFSEATLALRSISAISSLLTIYILYQIIIKFFLEKKKISTLESSIVLLTVSMAPYAVQFAHFGTTESLLMMLYSLLIYFSLETLKPNFKKRYLLYVGLTCGIAVGVKLSSLIFLGIPFICLLIGFFHVRKKGWKQMIKYLFVVKVVVFFSFVIGYVLSSPHNIISWSDFVGSIGYESAVALGKAEVFYTRQFFASLPYYFQFVRVFPYVLGLSGLLLFITGFFTLPEKNAKWWIIRLAFVIPFLTSGFIYAKWSRFLAICYPMMSLIIGISILRLYHFFETAWKRVSKIIIGIVVLTIILPAVAYLSIYTSQDVRFVASRWIQVNIPDRTTMLSETANVVDIPLSLPNKLQGTSNKLQERTYSAISFDFYNVDTNISLAEDLQKNLSTLDYILVPSRRVYANHTCIRPSSKLQGISYKIQTDNIIDFFSYKSTRCAQLENKYPILNSYYGQLFDSSKYEQIAMFTSYPRITLFGITLIEFPDEMSEETWTVFDHPVVRVYKKI